MPEVSCANLGVANCDYVAHGEDAEEVVDDITEHLEKEHDMDMPSTDAILDTFGEDSLIDEIARGFSGDLDEKTKLVIRRLRNNLGIESRGET